jgi:hypothetical protein
MGTWIRQNQIHCHLQLFECHADDRLVALAIIDTGNILRHRVIRSATISLNEAADTQCNMFIEYNGILVTKGFEQNAWSEFLRYLCDRRRDWDEVRLTNVPAHIVDEKLARKLGLNLAIDSTNCAWITPLTGCTEIESVIKKLGKNKRWQLRRSLREYQKEGELTIEAAADSRQAVDYFREMGILHSERWQRAGKSGSFARGNWVEFHTNLIEHAFDRNHIQLLRIRCGGRNVGFIYNFLWRGSVLVLQTGFASENRNALRPGYVSHLLAMQFNASLGFKQYDFMIGDSEYKRTLAEANSPQITARLQRSRAKFGVERFLQALAETMR